MLTKSFLFLHNFILYNLVNNFTYINGNNVMYYLLYYAKEFITS